MAAGGAAAGVLKEMMVGPSTPMWIVAVVVGIVVGWAWKPNWAHRAHYSLHSSSSSTSKPSSSASCTIGIQNDSSLPSILSTSNTSSCLKVEQSKGVVVGEDELEHLWRLVEEKDGGPAWIQMMDRSAPNMSYQAWRRDPPNGPPQYRSRTVYEGATPEMLRDFFWDDEFRLKWDDMILHAETLEECLSTGTMVVQWVRKFPFFCSDREYIIGRRIWESGNSYYCVTKGVPYDSIPKRKKPRRVDSYYSSWFIRAVESNRGDGQLSACEVLLFHHEEMGIPWEIAKLGVRQGMWGAVKNIVSGWAAYQKERESTSALSHCALMAHINTKVKADYLTSFQNKNCNSSEIETEAFDSPEKPLRRSIPRWAFVGGAIVLACSLDRGLLTKAVIFGVARRFANMGKRL